MDTPRQAIVFSGGGAYGAYEVGVLKALVERGWTGPEIVTGVSAGAFNAALLAGTDAPNLRQAVERMEEVWVNHIPGRVFHVRADPRALLGLEHGPYWANAARWVTDLQTLSFDFGRRLLRMGPVGPFDERLLQLVDLASFISVAPLEQLLREIIEPKRLRESRLKLSVIATNWRTGTPEIFRNARMTDADAVPILLASAAIPGFFPPREVDGIPYVDGGLVMNTPLEPAIDDGADVIRIIYLDPDISRIPLLKLQNTFDTLDRILSINLAFHINTDIEKARQVNRAIALFGEAAAETGVTTRPELAAIAGHWERLRAERPPRKLTIHRYHPRQDLGGVLGLLRFEKAPIQELIQKGYRDTIEHDCQANDCERPETVKGSPSQPSPPAGPA